ncbi:MAG: UDP-N-acetylglucosamine 2-epimerase (non-hydrolyzing) [Pseudomonadota bacterium]
MKLITILGARPQFIKAAAVSRAVAETSGVDNVLVHTGQHYDQNMSDVFFEELGIPKPHYHLEIGGGTHGQMTGRQLEAIEAVLAQEKPDAVVVYGDTNSTLAGGLAASKMGIPVCHVEAGLRSFNRSMPEEINRVLTDHLSTWLFAPTDTAVDHLAKEGIAGSHVVNVGDVMYDAALLFGDDARRKSSILDRLNLEEGAFRLATVHRQENTDNPERLSVIFEALRTLAKDRPLVLPMHPRTRKALELTGEFKTMTAGLTVTEPLGFFDVIRLMQGACVLLTDSGGMQKEAYFHGTPVVVLRDETEWVELVELGWAKIVSPVEVTSVVDGAEFMRAPPKSIDTQPYGDGDAAGKILTALSG